ncbi:hypothetical protein SAMN06297144_2068 [Sphingomonas guangdongensis]|uniref:Heme exporter protein D n=1 Tax=Sphingomonas guangdongensis TaxID=1141890 RepID=A0A285QZW7_9SPHN|nr:hypothetical protein [Sphingomonas guangdongensis]SOB86949.1 hypothetical protein SAMN06297144_2068 [Sphingomonas guangdongensis]
MNAWPFVTAAWGLTIGASALVAALSYRAMRRAENAARALRRS